jgi:hypothetical protein
MGGKVSEKKVSGVRNRFLGKKTDSPNRKRFMISLTLFPPISCAASGEITSLAAIAGSNPLFDLIPGQP